MEKPRADIVAPIGKESPVRKLVRLHFELALELGFASKRPLHETLWNALNTAGCDVILQLPTPDAEGVLTIVRLRENGQEGFLQVRMAECGFAIADEAEIDPDLPQLRARFDRCPRPGESGWCHPGTHRPHPSLTL